MLMDAAWHNRDREGIRGVYFQGEKALLHQPCFDIMHCWIFIKRHYHLVSDILRNDNLRWFWHQRPSAWVLKSKCFFLSFLQRANNWGGAQERGHVRMRHSSQFYQAGMRRCQRGCLRLLWYGSSLSAQMNPSGSDLATISQLQRWAHSP